MKTEKSHFWIGFFEYEELHLEFVGEDTSRMNWTIMMMSLSLNLLSHREKYGLIMISWNQDSNHPRRA